MRKYHPDGPQPRIPVWGPAGTAARMARAYDLPEDPGMNEEFDFRGLPRRRRGRGRAVHGRAGAVEHPVPAYALRVEADGRAARLLRRHRRLRRPRADRARRRPVPGRGVVPRRRRQPPRLHLTGAEAGRTATSAGVDRLVLTHIPPWHDPKVAFAEARAV